MHVPQEWLFGILAAMVASIYGSLLWEVRKLRAESGDRGTKLTVLTVMVKQVCTRLNIPFTDGD